MIPTDLFFLPFLQSKSATLADGDVAMACLQSRNLSESDASLAGTQNAEAYDAAVSEGWSVSQYARHCPTTEA